MRRSGLSGAVWVVLGCASLAAVLGGAVWFLAGRTLADADSWASVGGLVLGLAVGVPGLVVSIASLRVARRQAPAAPVDRLLEELATALGVEWRRERGVRDLNDLLPVRWSGVAPGLVDRPERVFGFGLDDPGSASAPDPTGRVDEAVRAFLRLPNRRLVVIGEPGAGKSVVALELALGLLAARSPGDPVPVILPIASWDPAAEEPDAWMARRIADTYPALGAIEAGTTFAGHLVRTRRVLPVLDGLDEMAEPSRAAAIHSVNRWVPRSEPLVLTCRSQAYRALFDTDSPRPAEPLAGAAVVELEPLRTEDVIAYLRDATPQRLTAKWDPVFEHLEREPAGPLAAALSTPLMATLARSAYSRTNADPAALLTGRLGSRATVEDHLLERFVPAHYPDGDAKALRWLRSLAWQLERRGRQDIAWWELPQASSRTAFVIVIALLFTLIGLVDKLFVDDPIVLRAALATGLAVGVGSVLAGRACLPARTGLRLPTTAGEASRALRAIATGLGASVAAGFGFGLVYGYVTLVFSGDDALYDGIMAGFAITTVVAVPLSLVMLMTVPADIARAATPRATLRSDRARTLLVAATATLSTGPMLWLGTAPWIGVFVGPAIGLTLWVRSAWGSLGVLRVATLARWPSRLPVRVLGFLDDAHRRGVLRQVGATYRFRHVRLQEHLARTHPYRRDRAGGPQAGMKSLYAIAAAVGLGAAVVLYFPAFSLSETFLVRVVALWLFPLVFGCYGLIGEWLAKHAAGKPLGQATGALVQRHGRWLLPFVFPFLLLRWRSRVLVTTAVTAYWVVLVQLFLVAVFPWL
ncbi:hypothetical protein FHS29_000158 [Saccharothrix tamanrassetensis]|uniref:NACHT domain-containing protein n=1 Tax=Saccharothrix tamanrassetensis TaxID=1051531 RepID=A0A841CBP2_9PSEU|nr:NACHT domain-containing protein [Saccharothrix tamanrassetensis]MBB5953588.1 hypothetical protein [Saccharothrix tamanrassetensis]